MTAYHVFIDLILQFEIRISMSIFRVVRRNVDNATMETLLFVIICLEMVNHKISSLSNLYTVTNGSLSFFTSKAIPPDLYLESALRLFENI